MKLRNRTLGLLAAVAMGVGLSGSANAAMDLGSNGIGYVRPTLLGSAFTITELANMINVYNGTSVSPIAGENYTVVQGSGTPVSPLAVPTTLSPNPAGGITANGQPSASINLGSGGYQYLVAQWDGPNGANAIYYIGNVSGTITLQNDLGNWIPSSQWENADKPNPKNPSDYGLSHYYLVAVPEPGTMVAGALLLLPFAASTVRFMRRKKA